jgi:hypothetical protein
MESGARQGGRHDGEYKGVCAGMLAHSHAFVRVLGRPGAPAQKTGSWLLGCVHMQDIGDMATAAKRN